MKRGDGQVKGITDRIIWHHVICDVSLNGFRNRSIQVEKGEPASQIEHVRSVREVSTVQFIFNGKAGDQFIR